MVEILGNVKCMSIRAQKSHDNRARWARRDVEKTMMSVALSGAVVAGLVACAPQNGEGQPSPSAAGNEADISRAARASNQFAGDSGLPTVDANDYVVKDSSLKEGRTATRFASPDRKINCEFQIDRFACITKPHGQWPAEARKEGFEPHQPQTVGWWPGKLDGKVETWVTQGAWPRVTPETKVLPNGQSIAMQAPGDKGTRITCSNRDNTMTCSNGVAGFTVGDKGLELR